MNTCKIPTYYLIIISMLRNMLAQFSPLLNDKTNSNFIKLIQTRSIMEGFQRKTNRFSAVIQDIKVIK